MKIGYRTKIEAEEHRWRLVRRRGAHPSTTVAYKCPHCGLWHVGHPRSRRKQGRRREW